MYPNMQNQSIRITVVDYTNRPVSNAEVKISSGKNTASLKYDKNSGEYITTEFKPGRYTISVSAKNLASQTREVFIGKSGITELFILGKEGMPFFYRGVVKVPFEPKDDLFGVAVTDPEDEKTVEALLAFARKQKIESRKTDENYRKNGLSVFVFPAGISADEKEKLLITFQNQKGVLAAGPLLKQDEKNASLMTDEIVVRFKGGIEQDEVQKIAKKLGLTIIRTIPYAGNAYQFRVSKRGMYRSLEVCQQLVEMKIVEYAEPNLYLTSEDDAIVPTNFLFPEQWDHPIINTPDAWQVLNDRLGAPQRFGSPDVVIAVVDSGVNTNHPQFSGNVSNGQPKMFTAFDFIGMVANNNAVNGSHGTCCASAAAGFTNISSTGGVPDGTVGVAGNCRVMGIRRGGTEADYSDIYIWIGGFDPNSTRVGFPARLTRGADIISSSYGLAGSIGLPISGIMRDTFDYLTTYGRGGKGMPLFFSAGNQGAGGCDGAISTLLRPWGSYEKCMSVSASTLNNDGVSEILAQYSNFGPSISFCAPSNGNCTGTHNPPQGYGAFTGTILNNAAGADGNTPRNGERQTTLTAAANTGATTITVASTAGMAIGQAIYIGPPSVNISPSEAKRVTNIAGNTITFTPALFANKANGTAVFYGNRDYRNNFGGTSYSTPVIAGVSALMLSVNNRLTWMEVREILRGTAEKIDPNNTNAVGRWRDEANRISTDPGYTGPVFSQFFGYGRINAAAAVSAADSYNHTRDIMIRDNMSDTGATTSSSPHWTGVDIWVRNENDGVAPASYNTDANTVHQPPIAGQSNWLSVRYRNRGTTNSFPFYIRAYIAHYPGAEFIYPDNFIPTVRPNGVIPNPLTPGTYLIGEQLVNPLAAGADDFVTFEWQQGLIPPQTVNVSGIDVHWHPCILVEVSPQDGFVPTGNHVWNNNNLAQKNISIIYPDSSGDNAAIATLGNIMNRKLKTLKFVIFPKPAIKTPYFICFPDAKLNDAFIAYAEKNIPGAKIDTYKKTKVVWINSADKITVELPHSGLALVIIGLGKVKSIEKDFDIHIVQYSGRNISGSCGIGFRKK